MNRMDDMFKTFLWKSRFLVLVTTVASLIMSVGMFYVASLDTLSMVKRLSSYGSTPDGKARLAMREEIVAYLVKGIDGYLIAIIVLVFGLGLYELFIQKIDPADSIRFSRNVLQIRNLDDLKQRLARLILLILMVEFFRAAMEVPFSTPLDLLYLSLGIALIGAATYLSHPREAPHE
jgi:uncharacterized membrane protein YqhA